ncbi:hypothetical protein DPEC_G00042970 [Dallia pectoralis]|uniref:Uncharacterized protein n=1 Tax=Dallia pectoralis TaxID=75939 RepID=A0ACC2H9L6_DALPE|nr:hypothetical protein DPEC_G00042970 [Dallia pectoralis]
MPRGASKNKPKKSLNSLELQVSEDSVSEPEHGDAMLMDTDSAQVKEVTSADIMQAIKSLKQDFHTEISGVLTAVKDIQANIRECNGRITQAEERVSSAEDSINSLQTKVSALEGKVKFLETKADDLENRSRRNNMRIVGIPEEEGTDSCTFMEKWFTENLSVQPPVILERAHRITGPARGPTSSSRTFIVKFQNYRDKERVWRASRAKGQLIYKNNNIRFHPDLSAEVYKQQRDFYDVRQKLRERGVDKHRMLYPAKLLVTHGGRAHTSNTPAAVYQFIAGLGEDA